MVFLHLRLNVSVSDVLGKAEQVRGHRLRTRMMHHQGLHALGVEGAGRIFLQNSEDLVERELGRIPVAVVAGAVQFLVMRAGDLAEFLETSGSNAVRLGLSHAFQSVADRAEVVDSRPCEME
jgi:hypothetical protein